MLASIFQKRSSFYFYRLVKPNISQFKSIEDLQYDLHQRQLNLIQSINNQNLTHNKTFNKQKQIVELLNLSQQNSKNVTQKSWNFTTVAPRALKSYTLEQNINDGHIDYPFLLEEIQPNLPDLNSIPNHFSYKRGVPAIPQYQFDKKVAYVFNLPQNVTQQQISQKIGLETIKLIKIQYCRLGLPAYAKVYFNSDQAVPNLILNNKNYIEIDNRICFIKAHFDKAKLQLKNRTLAIKNLKSDQNDLIIQLSKYGRILHLDYPTFITRNVSLEEVKNHYKNGQTLIRINIHKKDGTINSEYYPPIEQLYQMKTLQNNYDLDSNLIEKRQRQNAAYRNRMRYAPQVNVYEGKQNQISIQNMGYCIVTYSCTQQAQNCYFNLRFDNKVELFDRKTTQQFQIDQSYRKRILRFIDNQHRKTKQTISEYKTIYEKQYQQNFNQLNTFQKLVQIQSHAKQLQQNTNVQMGDSQAILSYMQTRFNQIKRDLRTQLGSNSFDELAQKQLFGKVLPKHDIKKPKIHLDVLPEQDLQLSQLVNSQRIKGISTERIQEKQQYYKGLKKRQTKRKNDSNRQLQAERLAANQDVEIPEQGAQAPVDDQNFTGQRGFSTIKKRVVSFRQRNALQQANYILRYCEYIRGVINQYQGVFTQSRLKNSNKRLTFLNPEGLTFADGNDYIVEEDLAKILQCMRNTEQAKEIFDNFWKDSEYFKSKNINIYEYKNQVQNNQYEALQKYFDTGVVKQVYEIEEGQDAQAKVKSLNSTLAGFGQQFRVHQNNDQKVIVKISKLQNIYPLDKLKAVANQRAKFQQSNTVTQKQLKLLQQLKHKIVETGQIPEQIRRQFNIESDKTLDDLFQQLGSEAGIYKKDIQTLLNVQNFTTEQLSESVGLQVELQKVRLATQQSKVSDYAKDPSNIQIRDRDGFFKVSKFRQI